MKDQNNYDFFSYKNFINDRINFRKSGGMYSDDFNMADIPGQLYFKIVFNFFDKENSDSTGYGLLHPTWMFLKSINAYDDTTVTRYQNEYAKYSTAYSYLMLNGEYERAKMLKKFIELLHNINTYSPWYWHKINGLGEGVKRVESHEGNIDRQGRKNIEILCLSDSIDNRIRTLIDLYRAVTWSWRTKRTIVPSNLLKFDMTICLMQEPIQGIHTSKDVHVNNRTDSVSDLQKNKKKLFSTATPDIADTGFHRASYKIFELHNCEFSQTIGTSEYNDLNNESGKQFDYKLSIFYDDIMEYSYNEFAPELQEIGDLIVNDAICFYDFDKNTVGSPSNPHNVHSRPKNESEISDLIKLQNSEAFFAEDPDPSKGRLWKNDKNKWFYDRIWDAMVETADALRLDGRKYKDFDGKRWDITVKALNPLIPKTIGGKKNKLNTQEGQSGKFNLLGFVTSFFKKENQDLFDGLGVGGKYIEINSNLNPIDAKINTDTYGLGHIKDLSKNKQDVSNAEKKGIKSIYARQTSTSPASNVYKTMNGPPKAFELNVKKLGNLFENSTLVSSL